MFLIHPPSLLKSIQEFSCNFFTDQFIVTFLLFSQLTGPTDHSYFDSYPPDEDNPPDELSGWDMDF